MNRDHPFRFYRRKVGDRRVYYVVYDTDPARPRSTGIEATEENYDTAVSWAYAHQNEALQQRITLKRATESMFTDSCRWRRRREAKGRNRAESYYVLHRNRLVNYVWKRFGELTPEQITPVMIDDWLLDLHGVQDGRELQPAMKDKIIQTLRFVFDELQYNDLAQSNPARLVTYFHDKSMKREPVYMNEFRKLFPDDQDELVRIWQSLSWATFFYIMATTGLRPGEVAAFDCHYWSPGVGYACATAIDPDTREIKGLKTERKGKRVKSVYLNDRAESLITQLVFQSSYTSGLLFPGKDGKGMPPDTSNKHFKASCKRAGVELHGRTQYCLRHFFITELSKYIDEKQVSEQAGWTEYRDDYDHRKELEKMKRNPELRELVNEVFRAPEP